MATTGTDQWLDCSAPSTSRVWTRDSDDGAARQTTELRSKTKEDSDWKQAFCYLGYRSLRGMDCLCTHAVSMLMG